MKITKRLIGKTIKITHFDGFISGGNPTEIVYIKDTTDVDSMGVTGIMFKINLKNSSFSVRKGYAHTGGNVTIEKSSKEIFRKVLDTYVAYFNS